MFEFSWSHRKRPHNLIFTRALRDWRSLGAATLAATGVALCATLTAAPSQPSPADGLQSVAYTRSTGTQCTPNSAKPGKSTNTTKSAKSAKVSTPPCPATGTGSSGAPGDKSFQGIYAFSGSNSAQLATDPDVAGRSLVYYWAQLEPKQGTYRWDLIDKDMAPWVAAGKKVILRVSVAGWASWDKAANSAHGTPAWVFAQGVKSVTEKDGAVLPQYWNPAFQSDLAGFLKAFGTRYDGNAHVELIDAAVGIGGETKPDSEKNPNMLALWKTVGYSDPLWWSTVQQTLTAYTQAFHKTPVAVMPDKTFLGGTPGYNESKTLAYAVSKGLWLQDNGLIPNRTLPAPWGQTPIVSEQRGPTSQTGDTLTADLNAALNDHATMILVFTSDLANPAYRAVIHQVATKAHTTEGAPSSTGTTSTGKTGTSHKPKSTHS